MPVNIQTEVKVHTLVVKSLKLLLIFQSGLQVSHWYMSLKQRLDQGCQCTLRALNNLSRSIIHLYCFPVCCKRKMYLRYCEH